MTGVGLVSLSVAFAGGLVSFASPCVLALVPGYLAFVSGVTVDRLDEHARKVVGPAVAFVAAFAVLFTLLGAGLGGISGALRAERRALEWVGGALLVLFGLLIVAGPRLRLMQRELRPIGWPGGGLGRLAGAAVTGLAFGIGWTPCIGPVLGSILTFAATRQSPWEGAALLFTYALGLGLPFIAASLALTRAVGAFRRLRRVMPILAGISAVGMVGMGVLVASGQMQVLTAFLSRFNRIG